MSDVFLKRSFPAALDVADLNRMVEDSLGCFGLHRVDWEESFLSAECTDLFCHFRAPDAESVRIALRQLQADMRVHWTGTIHDAPGVSEAEMLGANVLVHRHFEEPVELADLQAIEDGNVHCLEAHRVRFMRTFFSSDQRHMACLYAAPDAESVRIAQRQATMPVDSVWAVKRLAPDLL